VLAYLPVRKYLVALGATSIVAIVAVAQGSARPSTTAPPVVVPVKITITDSAIRMSPKVAVRGAVARFILVNRGTKPHTFLLGTLKHGTGKQTGFVKSLKPNEQSILVLFLDFRGTLPYTAPLPADRSKPKMKGIFRII
jgi:hypothetical protein